MCSRIDIEGVYTDECLRAFTHPCARLVDPAKGLGNITGHSGTDRGNSRSEWDKDQPLDPQ